MTKYLAFSLSVKKSLKSVSKYLKSSVRDKKLVLYLPILAIALQMFLPHTPLVKIEVVEVVVEIVLCKIFYFVCSI